MVHWTTDEESRLGASLCMDGKPEVVYNSLFEVVTRLVHEQEMEFVHEGVRIENGVMVSILGVWLEQISYKLRISILTV